VNDDGTMARGSHAARFAAKPPYPQIVGESAAFANAD